MTNLEMRKRSQVVHADFLPLRPTLLTSPSSFLLLFCQVDRTTYSQPSQLRRTSLREQRKYCFSIVEEILRKNHESLRVRVLVVDQSLDDLSRRIHRPAQHLAAGGC